MRMNCKVFVICFCVAVAMLLQTSYLESEENASPEIIVKNKSFLARDKILSYDHPESTAINSDTGDTFVVWQEFNDDGNFGRIINQKGKSTSKKLLINFHPGTISYGLGVAYNPVKREYLVTYSLHAQGSILGVRVDQNAKVIGKEFTIIPVTVENQNFFPRLVFNPQTTGYTLIWEQLEGGIHAASLDSSGSLVGSIHEILKNPGSNGFVDTDYYPRTLDVKPVGSKLFVLIQQRSSRTEADYWLVTVDTTKLKGSSASNAVKVNKKPVQRGTNGETVVIHEFWGASLATLSDGSAVVYFADQESVKRRKITSQGKVSGPPKPAFNAPVKDVIFTSPRVAFSTTSEGTVGLLVASANEDQLENPRFLWGQTLNAKGQPVGEPVKVHEYKPHVIPAFGSSLVAIPRKSTDKLFQFIWIQPEIESEVAAEIVKVLVEVHP